MSTHKNSAAQLVGTAFIAIILQTTPWVTFKRSTREQIASNSMKVSNFQGFWLREYVLIFLLNEERICSDRVPLNRAIA
jgi:hypothetical protein